MIVEVISIYREACQIHKVKPFKCPILNLKLWLFYKVTLCIPALETMEKIVRIQNFLKL